MVDRTPANLVAEIILVDDKSSYPHLGAKLDEYIGQHFPGGVVKLLRLEERTGLINARMAGINFARKDTVLLFLDSHIEATPGWIEPLLARIKENPKVTQASKILWCPLLCAFLFCSELVVHVLCVEEGSFLTSLDSSHPILGFSST